MRSLSFLSIVLLCLTAASAQEIQGHYVESRSADVYTGQCFANGEVNLVGDEAILAWHVDRGGWNGVPLEGLTVAAAVKARATLGDPYANPYPAEAVLMLDDQASPEQRAALEAFAHQMGGELLQHVQQVVNAPMELATNPSNHGVVYFRAGEFAAIRTRAINDKDHLCGNEVTFYPPLTKVVHAMPAVALTDSYRGPGLDAEWESHGRRSAFVGNFSQ
jgi:hypothetical protein